MNEQAALLQFDYEWREGDRDKAREIAKDYINANRLRLTKVFSGYTLEDLVREVDALRAAGRHSDRIIVDMWLLAEYQPQDISGELRIGRTELIVAAAEAIMRGEEPA